ncbi:MAG TPA: nuclear transport factor 2 family protein [Myxococcales bacterium]|nr:nuclear transport factor 2 family protein [Myxococcales bacterium]
MLVGCAGSGTAVRPGGQGWDAQAAGEAQQVMHKFHHAWDTMDMNAVEKAIADDGFLVTFEFTDQAEPVRLASKAELVAWLKKGFDDIKGRNASTVALPQTQMECRATADMAVCIEECDIIVQRPDGVREVTPHRGTSVLRKFDDGWKFTHWHVSESGTRRLVSQADGAATGAGHDHH